MHNKKSKVNRKERKNNKHCKIKEDKCRIKRSANNEKCKDYESVDNMVCSYSDASVKLHEEQQWGIKIPKNKNEYNERHFLTMHCLQ